MIISLTNEEWWKYRYVGKNRTKTYVNWFFLPVKVLSLALSFSLQSYFLLKTFLHTFDWFLEIKKLTNSKPISSNRSKPSDQNGRTGHSGGRHDDVVDLLIAWVGKDLGEFSPFLFNKVPQTKQMSVKTLTCKVKWFLYQGIFQSYWNLQHRSAQ